MRRYRLTFDPNPRSSRDAMPGSAATSFSCGAAAPDARRWWSRRDTTGELIELDVGEDENPLELFNHPYAYMRLRGHPGRAIRQAELAAA